MSRALRRALLLLFVAAMPAMAQEVAPDILAAQLGEWLVAPDDGAPGCRIRLGSGATIGGRVATPEPACAARLPRLADATAWAFVDGGVSLFDATRRRVMAFAEDETTLLKTRGDETPSHLLVKAKPGVDRAPSPKAMAGAWLMRRPGGPTLCVVTFAATSSGEDNPTLTLDPACDPAVRRLKLVSWRVEDFALMLYGAADASLRFEPGPGGFEKAEAGKPLELVRRP